jgi:hypothetical protein
MRLFIAIFKHSPNSAEMNKILGKNFSPVKKGDILSEIDYYAPHLHSLEAIQ